MNILVLILIVLLIIALVVGMFNMNGISIALIIKDFSVPYYQFGIHFVELEDEEGNVAEELLISLVLISISVIFVKKNQP